MKKLIYVTSTIGLLAAALTSSAAEPDFWKTPTIQGYGKIHALPNAAYQPQKGISYKIVFALTKPTKSPEDVNPSLDRVARTVNLYVAVGVPLDHLHFVVIASGEATPLALNNKQYQAKYGTPNPNIPLVQALRKAGVDVAICGQAVAGHHYDYNWIDPSITIALSALTTITTLEQQGYVLMPL
jgi:intracellular sulfur oxidation DsrE/DsrF family protein